MTSLTNNSLWRCHLVIGYLFIKMISVKQCKTYIDDTNLSDKEIEEIRNEIYALVEGVFDSLEQKSIKELDYAKRNSDDVTDRTKII